MFANLKNKILDEVKASPGKLQQFAQAAQAAVSSASSTTESVSGSDNFFSIAEEDTPQNSPLRKYNNDKNNENLSVVDLQNSDSPNSSLNNGIPLNRARRLSNTSIASDISFRLPQYDPPAVYHLQSDLDTASEYEESVSSASRLDVISKEQLHDAYKKSLDRYQKYRSRYTDLAKRYRDLERDSTKARSVLVETQDKAIRRISELREQCNLEQQAKAHLEEALRMEMDDMQCKIKAYQTKLKLIGQHPENILNSTQNEQNSSISDDSLIKLDSDDSSNLINLSLDQNSSENSLNLSVLNKKIIKLEETLLQKCNEILRLNESLNISQQTIETLKKREEENSIILAQNKLEIHSELENKESSMKKLKLKITELENKLQQNEKEKLQFKNQSTQLAEIKDKLKQMTELKQEFEAKIISHDHIIGEMKRKQSEKDKLLESTKKNADEQIKNLTAEFEHKLNDLKVQNDELNIICERNNNQEIDLAEIDNERNFIKTENNSMKENLNRINSENIELQKKIDEYQKQLNQSLEQIEINQNRENDLKKENQESSTKINDLNTKVREILKERESNENKIKQLEDELLVLRKQNEETDSETVIALKENLQKNLNELNAQIKSLQDTVLSKDNQLKSITTQFEHVKSELSQRLNEKEKYNNNYKSLKEKLKISENKVMEIKNERKQNEEKLEMEKAELKSQLEEEKRNLENKIVIIEKQHHEGLEGNERIEEQLKNAEKKLRQVEVKLQSVESENSQLAERNCLLEENSNRLEKIITENETILKKEKSNFNETIQSSELNLSDLRMKCETATENERKLNEKISLVLDENSRLHNAKELMEHEFRSLQDQCEEREKEKLCVLDSNKCLEDEVKKIRDEVKHLHHENNNFNDNKLKIENELSTLTAKRQNDKEKREKLQNDLKTVQKSKENLETELKVLQDRLNNTSQNDIVLSNLHEENLKLKEACLLHENECKNVKAQLTSLNQQFVDDVNKLEKSYKEKIDIAESEMSTMLEKLNGLGKENNALKEQNDSFKKELDTLNNQNQARLAELENLLKETNDHNQTLQQSVLNATDFEKKLQNYEQLKIENEYLNTLTNQLETDMRKQKEDKQKLDEEINQMKIKMKSQQCELYVLTENKEKHEVEIAVKLAEIDKLEKELKKFNESLEEERTSNKQKMDHTNFISQQNDAIQRELLLYQTKLQEAEKLCGETRQSYEEVITENIQLKTQVEHLQASNNNEIEKLKTESEQSQQSINDLTNDLISTKLLLEKLKSVENENDEQKNRIKELEIDLAEKIQLIESTERKSSEQLATINKTSQQITDIENVRKLNESIQNELEILKINSTTEITNLRKKVDDLTSNSKNLSEQLSNFNTLKEQAAHLQKELNALKNQESRIDNNYNNNFNNEDYLSIKEERDDIKNKLDKIMHEVQDVSNRNLFLEQQCENYLILEQSNERLKLANQKLTRQLDETLVSMQHSNEGIQANTEFEYLKNIMFQYLTGTVNGNNETLVKVIAAVLKFSPQQTQVAVEKEHQKHSLLGQINNLL